MTYAEKMFNFIKEQTEAGATIYATNYLISIKITAKSLTNGLVRVHNGHCEVARGARWDSINGCKIAARF